jgi:hypothetical protein
VIAISRCEKHRKTTFFHMLLHRMFITAPESLRSGWDAYE